MGIRCDLSSSGNMRGNMYRGVGSGGTVVEITPTYNSGTKIADYSLDGVSGELYVPNATHDVLWTNQGVTNPASISLPHNLTDYDIVIFTLKRTAYGQSWKLQFTYDFKHGIELNEQILFYCWSNNNEYVSYVFSAADTLSGMQNGNALLLTQIEGIKY